MYSNNPDINIMFSGGADSLTTALGFMECGYDVNHTIVLFKDHDHICNAREVKEAFKFAGKHRIKYDVLELAVSDFLDEWVNDPKWSGYGTQIMDQSLQIWAVSKIDRSLFTVLSDPGGVNWIRLENGDYSFIMNMHTHQTQEIIDNFTLNGTTWPWWTSPKATSAFFAGDVAERVVYDNILNLSPGESFYCPARKYKALGMWSGFDITEYEVPKTSVQMFDSHKWQKKYHKAMSAGHINIANIDFQLGYSIHDFHKKIENGTISDYWIDYKDWPWDPKLVWYGGELPYEWTVAARMT